ncbi:hypothetical protein Pan97_00680 [Bremerella volcania]|uniref:Uncharacterized protein n=1 Tax=Bremerella volcania TaxID=2527984 RepID=A0A518C1J4_9BACT|nr:hypothetical protein [Bremerella volcania]QDU73101.1 hypothetical protein Pan97_00680 [Bremerella volcania]
MATAEIIRERPAWVIPEVAFDAYGNCLWVLFEDDEYRQWCGIFGAGNLHYEGKLQNLTTDEFMVVVAGRLYRVAANDRSLRMASEERMLTDAVYDRHRDLIIACDWTHLLCYDANGLKWKSKRVSLDGIAFDRIDEDCVYGTVNDLSDDGASFTLWLDALYVDSDVDPRILGM